MFSQRIGHSRRRNSDERNQREKLIHMLTFNYITPSHDNRTKKSSSKLTFVRWNPKNLENLFLFSLLLQVLVNKISTLLAMKRINLKFVSNISPSCYNHFSGSNLTFCSHLQRFFRLYWSHFETIYENNNFILFFRQEKVYFIFLKDR